MRSLPLCRVVASGLVVAAASLVGPAVSSAAAPKPSDGQVGLSPGAVTTLDRAEAHGTRLDTSRAALGDPANPTAQDVQRAFAKLKVRADSLPSPQALKDPNVRRALAFMNRPDVQVQSSQSLKATFGPDGQLAPPPALPSTPQPQPPAAAAGRQARSAQSTADGEIYFCSLSLGVEPGEPSTAIGLWSCPVQVYNVDTWSWYSLYTGELLEPPTYGDVNLTEPHATRLDGSTESNGQAHHRSVHWDVTLCSSQCLSGGLIVHDT